MRMSQRFTLCLLVLLSGCTADVSLRHDFRPGQMEDQGLVIMSITNKGNTTFGGANSFAPELYIRAADNSCPFTVEGHRGTLFDSHLSAQGNPWPIGRLVTLKLRPGTYEVWGWKASGHGLGSLEVAVSKQPPHIFFEAKAHELTCVGNLDLCLSRTSSTYVLSISDEAPRDLEAFKKKWPNLSEETVAVQLACVKRE
jgi:hypothetical protein